MRLMQNHNKGRWWALRPRPAYTFQRCNRLSRCRLTVRCSLVWRGRCVTFRAICGQLEGQKIGTFPAEITGKPPFIQTGSDFVLAISQIPQKVTKTGFFAFSLFRSPLLPLTLSASAPCLSRSAFGGAPSAFLPVSRWLVLTLYQILRDRASGQ